MSHWSFCAPFQMLQMSHLGPSCLACVVEFSPWDVSGDHLVMGGRLVEALTEWVMRAFHVSMPEFARGACLGGFGGSPTAPVLYGFPMFWPRSKLEPRWLSPSVGSPAWEDSFDRLFVCCLGRSLLQQSASQWTILCLFSGSAQQKIESVRQVRRNKISD